jgi:hypothetical protein
MPTVSPLGSPLSRFIREIAAETDRVQHFETSPAALCNEWKELYEMTLSKVFSRGSR